MNSSANFKEFVKFDGPVPPQYSFPNSGEWQGAQIVGLQSIKNTN